MLTKYKQDLIARMLSETDTQNIIKSEAKDKVFYDSTVMNLNRDMQTLLENIPLQQNTDAEDVNVIPSIIREYHDQISNYLYRLSFLMPILPIEAHDSCWNPITDEDMLNGIIGKTLKVNEKHTITIETIEIHKECSILSPASVYRINKDNRLAIMPIGNTIITCEPNENGEIIVTNNATCACFVNEFPFRVPYPIITKVIKYRDGENEKQMTTITDVRNLSEEPITQGQLCTPTGTSLYVEDYE